MSTEKLQKWESIHHRTLLAPSPGQGRLIHTMHIPQIVRTPTSDKEQIQGNQFPDFSIILCHQ